MFGYRPDGDVVNDISPSRRIMPFIMKTRNESAVYFEQHIDAAKVTAFIEEHRAATGLRTTLLHVLLWVTARVLEERSRLNRFVAGHRIYQRRGIWLSFSMKAKKEDGAPIVVVKRRFDANVTLDDVVKMIDAGVSDGRSGKKTQTDHELKLLFMLPTFLVARVVGFLRLLDQWGLMPRAMIDPDPMFASAFVAPLGSIGMDAPYHHLYEYGNIPIFVVTGAVRNGKMPIRYTLDERVEDGLYCAKALEILKGYLENPERIAVTRP